MEFNNEIVRSLGMTLVHSLWEGMAILILILFTTSLAGKSNARLRYTLLVSGHLLMLAVFFITWYTLYHRNILSLQMARLSHLSDQAAGQFAASVPFRMNTAGLFSTVHHFLEPFYPALAMGWILGFAILFLRMTGGFYLSYQIIRKDVFLPDLSMQVLFEKAAYKLGMRGTLRLTTRKISPMVIGIMKPCVIMPVAVLSGLSSGQVEAIFVHELAHIRRFDHVVMIIQTVATQILFFHPVAWYLSNEINRERENCCDDIVMNTFSDPINYIKALTMIQELNVGGHVPANALMGRSKKLLNRVKRLLKTETKNAPTFRLAIVFLMLITLGITVITLASAGNSVDKIIVAGMFSGRTARNEAVHDTTKNRKDKLPLVKKGSVDREDEKKKKEYAEATAKLEKAKQEVEKAHRELEKALRELEQAREKVQAGDMASVNDEIRRAMEEARLQQFKMERDVELQDYMRNLQEEMIRVKKEVQEHMANFRQEDWKHFQEEWQKSGIAPFPPCIPPVPPFMPETAIPEPPEMDAVPPVLDPQQESLQPDQELNEKQNAERLELKLREAEKESE
jgi:beta-lactamase regulating signal transducer with metallopeptidase domain